MPLGPFNTPITLASRPLMAVFWTLVAPFLILMVLVIALNLVTDDWASKQFTADGDFANAATISCVGYLILFAGMSFWSDRIGAGPFAGAMKLSPDWIGIAAITGPIVFSGTSMLMSLVLNDDGTWWLRDEAVQDLPQITDRTLLMAVLVVVLIPLVEEVSFRGIALGCLVARRIDPVTSVLITTLGFTAIHTNYSPLGMIPIFIGGLYLGALRLLSGTVAAPLIAHISANFIVIVGYLMTSA